MNNMGVDSRCSYKGLFKKLDILPVPCEHVFSLLMFLIKSYDNFLTSTAVHGVNTRTKHQLQEPL
jgi:hypothetical protein